jgi:hypothetical protein
MVAAFVDRTRSGRRRPPAESDKSPRTRSAYSRCSASEIAPSPFLSISASTVFNTATPGASRSSIATRFFSTEIVVAWRYSSVRCANAGVTTTASSAAVTAATSCERGR